ncbi:hypothetical protein [Streptomyces silvensis]|uniref:Uncharacterized protein n=1 Tax=Streptomyces silvensis TaxID=1765722 RepID=A0A0W7WSI4_9ACTN|nr:hypothetical protein [Streptomyces silvensis]KUF13525.1 hypothetical protein AT728_33020 [Streptomyces silvensis]
MTASLTCKKIASLATGSVVYAWETAEGTDGNILIDPEGAVARPCTAAGDPLGDTLLDKRTGNVRNPDPDPGARRAFLQVAAAIFQERQRQGRLPDTVTRAYW